MTTILSEDGRLVTSSAILRVVVRDVDLPDLRLAQAFVISNPAADTSRSANRSASTTDSGIATFTGIASGRYTITVRRLGYHTARFAILVRPACQQVLEVYLPAMVTQFDYCQVRTASTPPCHEPETTPSRAVLTTCQGAV